MGLLPQQGVCGDRSAVRGIWGSRPRSAPVAALITEAFSQAATRIGPIFLIAGLVMTIILLPSFGALFEPYGALLLAKPAAFTVLMGLAAANKWRLAPALAHGETRAFRGSVAAEFSLIVAALAVTAVMTSFFSPEA